MKIFLLLTIILALTNLAVASNDANKTQAKVATTGNNDSNSSPAEIRVGVKGMVCAFCAQGIEKNFLKQPEVSKIDVSLENKYIKIKFKEGMTMTQDKISKLLKDAGYESVFGQ